MMMRLMPKEISVAFFLELAGACTESCSWHDITFFTFSQKSIAFTFSPTASSVIFIVQLHLISPTQVYGLEWSVRFWKLRRYLHSILVLHELANLSTFLIFCGDTVLESGSLTQNFTRTHFPSLRSFYNFVWGVVYAWGTDHISYQHWIPGSFSTSCAVFGRAFH